MVFSNIFSRTINIGGGGGGGGIPVRINTPILGSDIGSGKGSKYIINSTIGPNDKGQELFDNVVATIGLHEKWFFGLQYIDNRGLKAWLDMDCKVLSQQHHQQPNHIAKKFIPSVNNSFTLEFDLRIQYYPEDVTTEIIQECTLVCLILFNFDFYLIDFLGIIIQTSTK